MAVSDVDIPRVVSVAEDVEFYAGGSVPQRRCASYFRILVRIRNDCLGSSIYFTCRLVYDFADSHYFILVIVHFNYEYLRLWWDFFVGDFSRRTVDTFQWAFVDLFVDGLVDVLPVLVFLPRLVVEACACEGGG